MGLSFTKAIWISLLLTGAFSITGCTPFEQSQPAFHPQIPTEDVFKDTSGVVGAGEVHQRKFPYPYKSMLSISSDIDGTTPGEFVKYHRFLNTKENTPMGKGLGLDIADSFWMYMGSDFDNPKYMDNENHTRIDMITYYKGISKEKKDAELIKYYWRMGWIDSMHGIGDFNRRNSSDNIPVRSLTLQAWDALKQDQIHPEIWINHGDIANKENFGAPPRGLFVYQKGDLKGSAFYHTDVTLKNGIHFLWNSISDNQFGFDTILFPIHLRDGQSLWGFHRYGHDLINGNYQWTWSPKKLDQQLTKQRLDELVKKQQFSVITNHFGGGNEEQPFPTNSLKALQLLASYNDNGKILVARTSRLLHYDLTRLFLDYEIITKGNETNIIFHSIKDPVLGKRDVTMDDVRGITFYAENPRHVHFFIHEKPILDHEVQMNPADDSGKRSIGIKWFNKDTTDYTIQAPSSSN